MEWKEKMRKKKMNNIDFSNPGSIDTSLLMGGQSSGGLNMGVAHFTPGAVETPEEAERIAVEWMHLVQSGGRVHVRTSAIGTRSVIFNFIDGDFMEVKNWVLEQPIIDKFTWNQQTYYANTKEGESRKVQDGDDEEAKKAKAAKKRAKMAREDEFNKENERRIEEGLPPLKKKSKKKKKKKASGGNEL